MKENTFLWLDLEMTGLDPQKDIILEIAVAITDDQLNLIAQGPSLVIHQTQQQLAVMSDFVRKLHEKSGLLTAVAASSTTLQEAEQVVYDFIVANLPKEKVLLAGNSIWQDRSFLVKYMPRIVNHLHYRILDVSAVKELVRRWYPNNPNTQFKKADNHRAAEDVMASIEELKHYRKHFFVG